MYIAYSPKGLTMYSLLIRKEVNSSENVSGMNSEDESPAIHANNVHVTYVCVLFS